MKNILVFLLLFALFGGCSKKEEIDRNIVKYNLVLSGINVVPANVSSATANFEGTYDKSTKILTFKVTYSGITPTLWHFHKGDKLTSLGTAVYSLGPNPKTPFENKTVALSALQETDLLYGNWYVNIHSALYPNGELRAQLLP
jgi:CHRD domain